MGISFRYKKPGGSSTESSVSEEFNRDAEFFSSKEDLEADLNEFDHFLSEELNSAETEPEVPAPAPVDLISQARIESNSPFLKLADFIKTELKNLPSESPEAMKAQKAIAFYEKRTSQAQRKQKGLQLKKVA